jgi:hypothetical protein
MNREQAVLRFPSCTRPPSREDEEQGIFSGASHSRLGYEKAELREGQGRLSPCHTRPAAPRPGHAAYPALRCTLSSAAHAEAASQPDSFRVAVSR